MSFKDKDIIIQDWTGRHLYIGPYDDKQVDAVLDANRCPVCEDDCCLSCEDCSGTGYRGDFEVYWVDESDKKDCNVYEYINY